MMLADSFDAEPDLALALVQRLTELEGGEAIGPAIVLADLDALLLRIRQMTVGDNLVAVSRCIVPTCAQPVDISFGIGQYLDHNRPRLMGAARLGNDGWYVLAGSKTSFRLPTLADVIETAGVRDAVALLRNRCVSTEGMRDTARAERAMEALAPSLATTLNGSCPECGSSLSLFFDPMAFVLEELRDRARFLYEDVDILAERYHWTEREIMAIPSHRRRRYVEQARRAESG